MTDIPPVHRENADPARAHVADELQRLVLDSTHVQEFLTQLSRHAAESLSDGDITVHCGVTLLRDRRPGSVASSSERARYMDEMQHSFDEGPCLSAARNGAVFHASDLETETRWPLYIGQIRDAGISSIMAVPFNLEDEAQGALNLYGEHAHAFDVEKQAMALSYASQASASLRLAVRIAKLADRTEDLKAAMASRTIIDVAVGVVMGQNRCSQDEAFAILQRASSTRNVKLREVAARIVNAAGPGEVSTHFEA